MADDITLTVRVRDMSRGELTRLNAQVNRLRQNFRNASNGSNSTSQNFNRLGTDVDRLTTRLRNMTRTGNLTRQQFQGMTRDARLVSQGLRRAVRDGDITRSRFRAMARDLESLRARMRLLSDGANIFQRLGAHAILFGDRLRRAGTGAGFLRRNLANIGDWGLRKLSRFLGFMGATQAAITRVTTAFAKMGRGALIALAILALIAPAGQALGALLVTALGGAFIALGAFALKGSTQVKSAFGQMKSSLTSTLRDAAQPLAGPLSQGLLQVAVSAGKVKPLLTQAFASAAPLVKNLFGAITDLGAKALPGIISALQSSKGPMAGFREAMGAIGTGFGRMFQIITQGNEENLTRAWVALGTELRNVLESLGEFISSMLKSGTASLLLLAVFRTLTGLLNLVAGALDAVDAAFGGLFRHIADSVSGFKNMGSVINQSFDYSGRSVADLRKELEGVNKEIDKRQKDTKGIIGPTRKFALDEGKEGSYNELLARRASLLGTIKAAEEGNTGAVEKEADAYLKLVEAIQSLADLNRNYLDAQSAENQAIDDAKKKLKDAKKNHEDYSHALKFTNGQLDTTTEIGRKAYGMLSNIAQTTQEATKKAIAAHAPWDQIGKAWKRGYDNIVQLGRGFHLSETEARQLATTILGMPPTKELEFKIRTQDAINSLDAVVNAMETSPDAKEVTVKVLSSDAQQVLRDMGFQITQLPDGSFKITAETGTAKDNVNKVKAARDALKGKNITLGAKDASSRVIGGIQRMLANLHDKGITITTTHRNILENLVTGPSQSAANALRKQAERFGGGATGGSAAQIAKRGFATGGSISGQLLEGPGTTTSDSILARLSRGEFVMKAASVRKYGLGFMHRVNEGTLNLPGFARGGSPSRREKLRAHARAEAKARARARAEARAAAKKSQDVRDAQGALKGSFGISYFGRLAGYKRTPFEHNLASPEDINALVSNLNETVGQIRKAFKGKTEKRLEKQFDSAGKALIKQEKNLTKVNASLEKAKTKLDDLKQSASQLRDSVTQGVLSATAVTRVANGDNNVTLSDVMRQMQDSVAKSGAFADALKQLRARGVSKDIIQQISDAGIEGGGLETAGAILSGSDSDITNINEMQKRIHDAASSAGKTASDALFAAGIKAAEGLVKGLQKKQKSIEDAMLRIARSMEKAIKKALGIHSPSRVMQEVGHFTAEGFAVGMKKNKAVDTAWTSMLNTTATSNPGSGGGAGGHGGQYVMPIYIGNKLIDEVWLDTGRRVVRTRGGNVQTVLGRKTS